MYVADREYNVVLVLGPDGSFHSQLGHGKLLKPTGLAFDGASDRLYVTDKDNHRVLAFDTLTGQLLVGFGFKGSGDGQFLYPWGIAISNHAAGAVIAVADSRNARIQFFTKDGVYLDCFNLPSVMDNPTPDEPKDTKKKPTKPFPRGLSFDHTGTSKCFWRWKGNQKCLNV